MLQSYIDCSLQAENNPYSNIMELLLNYYSSKITLTEIA